ncbi:hypothetical protein PMSD_17680 [Paenibacillus macquariensis subsp. defensor]|nr:hypothetical protein PMSD_17680 [Paenibacillus macquariensis subsp. defensor]
MQGLKKDAVILLESIVFLAIGLLLTVNVASKIYESFGIEFIGNVWVNWFGVSYFLFVLYTVITGLFIMKNTIYFKQRLKSKSFWFLFIGSIYIISIPFVKGENPF